MKKFVLKSITLLLPILFLLSCAGEKIKNDLIKTNLSGKVKKISESVYSGVEKLGNIEKDSLKGSTVYKYNEKGYSLLSDRDRYHSTDPNCKYDEKGNPIEYTYYGKYMRKWKLKWDDKGRVIESSVYKNDGNLEFIRSCKFDNKGNNIEVVHQTPYVTDPTRFIYSKYVYKYDDKDNKIGWYSEDTKDGSLTPIETYKYDGKENKIEEKYFSDGSLSQITKYIYDNKENLIEVNSSSRDGVMSSPIIYKYDDKGNKLEEIYTPNSDNASIKVICNYRYEYDKTGNWIKKSEFEDGKLKNISEREIEYY